jgi:hypothetical protein
MVETITFRPIYIEDLALGTGTEQVTLADGSVAALTKVNLTTLASGVASGSSYLDLSQQSTTPDTPSASTTRLYQKTDGYWYVLSSAGTETEWPSTLGTVVRGTWNGTAIGVTYGGTGLSALVAGDLLYASATNTASRLAIGTANYVVKSTGTAPTWAAAPITAIWSGFNSTTAGSEIDDPDGDTTSSEAVVGKPSPITGTLSKLYVALSAASAYDVTATIRIAGADSTLTVTIAAGATTGVDTAHTPSVTAGDAISMKLACNQSGIVVKWSFILAE